MLRDKRCLHPGDEFVTLRLVCIFQLIFFLPHRFSPRSDLVISVICSHFPLFFHLHSFYLYSSILLFWQYSLRISLRTRSSLSSLFSLSSSSFLSSLSSLSSTGPEFRCSPQKIDPWDQRHVRGASESPRAAWCLNCTAQRLLPLSSPLPLFF